MLFSPSLKSALEVEGEGEEGAVMRARALEEEDGGGASL